MHGTFFRGVVLGSLTAALVLGASVALAGTGVGGIFNLGKSNTVNGTSSLRGTTAGSQLSVSNSSTSSSAYGLQVTGVSAAPALLAQNSLGPAAMFKGGSSSQPFTVNSIQRVANLNADLLDGLDSSLFYRLRTRAATNTITSVALSGVNDTSVTIGTDGLPLISYKDVPSGHLMVAHCGNLSCSSGNTTATVDSSNADVGLYTSVTIGTDGLPLISYYDGSNGDLKVAHCGNLSCSSGDTTTTVSSSGNTGRFTSVTIGTDGLPLISFSDTFGALLAAHCGNLSCSSGNTITTVDGSSNIGGYTSVTIGTDGLPLIGYYDEVNGNLDVAHCGNVACTSGDTTITMDSSGDVGRYTAVTIGTDGLPLISYYDGSNHALKIAHCGNPACTSGNTTTPVALASAQYTSATIGADGLPLVGFTDNSGYLDIAHCAAVNCTSSLVTTARIDSSSTGGYTSVTIGADGLPLIGYDDTTNGRLRVAHCADAFCVSWFRRR